MERDGFACVYCGRSKPLHGVVLHVDHRHPVAGGGSDDPGNLVTACLDCNLGKSDKVLRSDGHTARGETYGLSFDSRGGVEWQFRVKAVSEHAAQLETYSWMSGEVWSAETVSPAFLRERCLLYASREAFKHAAAFWGDIRAARVNRTFAA